MRGGEESASVLVERCRAGCDVGTLCGGCGGTGVVGPREMASLRSGVPGTGPALAGTLPSTPTALGRRQAAAMMTAMAKRRRAALWLQSQLGVEVPFGTDYEFRSALSGGMLCALANLMLPDGEQLVLDPKEMVPIFEDGVNKKECTESESSIEAFLWVAPKLGLKEDMLFSVEDLIAGPDEERPLVTECLLQLQDLSESMAPRSGSISPSLQGLRTPSAVPSLHEFGQKGGHISPMGGFYNLGMISDLETHKLKGTAGPKSPCSPIGVTNLMQQCTSMLKGYTPRYSATPTPTPQYSAPPTPTPSSDVPEPLIDCFQQTFGRILERMTKDQYERNQSEVDALKEKAEKLEQYLEDLKNQDYGCYLPEEDPELLYEIEQGQMYIADLEDRINEEIDRKSWLECQLSDWQKGTTEIESEISHLQKEIQLREGLLQKIEKTLKQNKELYNTVQDLKGNVRVICRLKPGAESEALKIFVGSNGELSISSKNLKERKQVFQFDNVLGASSSQITAYVEVQPLIRSLMDGYNVSVFAHGAPASGKTYTLVGQFGDVQGEHGICQHAFRDIFRMVEERNGEVSYKISLRMSFISDEQVNDIIACSDEERTVSSENDALDELNLGMQKALALSVDNSGHIVVTVKVQGEHQHSGERIQSRLHIVDLSTPMSNLADHSLQSLGNALVHMAAKESKDSIQDSCITQLLKKSLSCPSKAVVFLHLSAEHTKEDTLPSLSFGARITQANQGKEKGSGTTKALDAQEAVHKLQSRLTVQDAEIESLKQEIQKNRENTEAVMKEKEGLQLEIAQLKGELKLKPIGATSKDSSRTKSLLQSNPVRKTQRQNPPTGELKRKPQATSNGVLLKKQSKSEAKTKTQR